MDVPAKCKELGIEKIIFGPAALMAQGVPVEVKLSYEVLQERTAYVLNAIAVHDDLLAALEEAEFALHSAAEQYAADKPHRSTVLDGRLEIVRQAITKAKGSE